MDAPKGGIRTSALWEQLIKAPSIEQFFGKNEAALGVPEFGEYISALCRARGEAPARVIQRADIERSFGYQIFRGDRRPSRETALQLAFGLQSSIAQAQELLARAGHSPLYPRVCRDVAIGYCLHHGLCLLDAQGVLAGLGLTPIGGAI